MDLNKELEEKSIKEVFFESLSHVEDPIHSMSVPDPSAMLDPNEAQNTVVSTDISVSEELSLSGEKLEHCEETEESECSGIQICIPEENLGGVCPKEYHRDMSADQAIPGEKLEHFEDTGKRKCSEIQIHLLEQHFGGARPKEYRRDMGANRGIISGEKLEHCEDAGEGKCSEIPILFPEQHFGGARPKEYRRDIDADEVIPGEKLELCRDIEGSKCSKIQIHIPEQQFGGARPKEYCRDIGADQAIPGEKLEHREDISESKCSEIQIGSPEQHFGAHSIEYDRGMSASQAVSYQDDVPKKYYAVAFPTEDFIIKDDPLIYEQKKDALQAIQQNPGARFREFTSRREALQYASIPYATQMPSSPSEANLMFKTLSKQELDQFQKCIEDGDVTYFLELVWSNPRYLINENDYPTIIQEETQTNALHIAAIRGQVRIFVQILHVLQDSQFMSILHPKDELSRIQARIRCLVGFYLNMTDSVLCETPLHLACRFGYDDIVQIIMAFSESLIKNKLDKSLGAIICRNCHNCSPNHKRTMLNLFADMYYVPIVQDEVCKYVDKPCDAQTVLAAMTTHPLKVGSPAIYCAFAGPAPYAIVKKIYHHLKRNKYVFLKAPMNAVMASSQKRIEKDGRKLSKKYHIGWIEYWRSLDAWLDISSSTGLKFLEKHLNKRDIQINILPDDPPVFLDIIKNFIEEFVVKISEIVVTCDKLSFFHELQTLVLFMDCFIKYPFSNEIKILDIHEELGHILFLKLTEDNHRNIEKFEILKLLHLSQFSYVACYQKSIWKMLCCILRFASYFQQDSDFVVKPACQCSFAIVEDLYVYSSKSCYFKLLSWRQDITNELVQKYEAMLENPVPEERETPNIPQFPDVSTAEKDHDDFAPDICTLDQYIQFYAMDQAHMYKKYYLQSTTFIFVYCTLILNSYQASENFMEIFKNVIKSWEPICKLHYQQQDINLISIHYEMAFCLFVQFYNIPAEIVQWCKIHLKREISSVASTSHEWTHLMCVTNLFLSMLEGNKWNVPCECQYYIDPATESVNSFNCVMLLRRLRKQLCSFKLRTSESQMRSDSVESKEESGKDQSSDKEEVYVTPPDSSPRTKSIYVEGDIFSDEDINIYHALVEARVDISKYHHIGKWKSQVKHILGSTY